MARAKKEAEKKPAEITITMTPEQALQAVRSLNLSVAMIMEDLDAVHDIERLTDVTRVCVASVEVSKKILYEAREVYFEIDRSKGSEPMVRGKNNKNNSSRSKP